MLGSITQLWCNWLKAHLSIPASLHLSSRFPHGCTDFLQLSHHFQRYRPSPPLLALANCRQSLSGGGSNGSKRSSEVYSLRSCSAHSPRVCQ